MCAVFLVLTTSLLAQHSDPEKMAEHQGLMDLLPVGSEDITATSSGGNWSSSSTWIGGMVPGAGDKVRIPEGSTVTYDLDSSTVLDIIRVDGKLEFPTNQNLKLVVDTLFTTGTSELIIGSETNRVAADKTITIEFPDNGIIDTAVDPTQIGRGLITHGKVRIHGDAKSPFARVSANPIAGDTTINLEYTPTGWRVGDRIVVTHKKGPKSQTVDGEEVYTFYEEVRTINAINGTTLTLGSESDHTVIDALDRNHDSPASHLRHYVANLTRNIVLRSQDGSTTPSRNRGHVMFMHNPDVVVEGVGFYHLGRSDKTFPFDDFELDANGERKTDANGDYIPGPSTNIRGHYACHFHRAGATDAAAAPAIARYNAVEGSQGWGFVNHDSYVRIEDNASFHVVGSHFVTETGNELGTFKGNVAIRSTGGSGRFIKNGVKNHDLAHSGYGFWFQGRNLEIEDNISAAQNTGHFVFFTRGEDNIKPLTATLLADNPYVLSKGSETMTAEDVIITDFRRNEAIGGFGLDIIKTHPFPNHGGRHILEDFLVWHASPGVEVSYSGQYTFRRFEIWGISPASWRHGFHSLQQMKDLVLEDVDIHALGSQSVTMRNSSSSDPTDALLIDVRADGDPITGNEIHGYEAGLHQLLTASDLNPGTLDFAFGPNMEFSLPDDLSWPYRLIVEGTVTDSAGAIEQAVDPDGAALGALTQTWWAPGMLRSIVEEGVYHRNDGSRYIVLTDSFGDRVSGDLLIIDYPVELPHSYDFEGPDLGAGPFGADVLTNLAGRWTFEGNTNDVSGVSNISGTLGGGATLDDDGSIQADGSLNLTANGSVMTVSGFERPTEQFAYSMWVRPAVDITTSTGRMDLMYGISGARPHITFNRDGGSSGRVGIWHNIVGNSQVTSDQRSWAVGQWYHLVFTYDGTAVKVYVNGEEEGSQAITGTSGTSTGLYVGARNSNGGNRFNGHMDDVRVYDRGLTATEVLAIYQAQ